MRSEVFKKRLLIYFWLCWIFMAALAFSMCEKLGLLSNCAWASHFSGFSCGIWAPRQEGFSS